MVTTRTPQPPPISVQTFSTGDVEPIDAAAALRQRAELLMQLATTQTQAAAVKAIGEVSDHASRSRSRSNARRQIRGAIRDSGGDAHSLSREEAVHLAAGRLVALAAEHAKRRG
ncbi:hypothetical protein [Jatrophihabitans sp. GAS493]|uniref:hypothetical protein n=1 Tax=Jatrophihabitans sp. GAS493 TaxID=1907575 RepID=UPI000BB90B8F|nr:hypothetical protein [Jatrophihabitans sp. GAS493]